MYTTSVGLLVTYTACTAPPAVATMRVSHPRSIIPCSLRSEAPPTVLLAPEMRMAAPLSPPLQYMQPPPQPVLTPYATTTTGHRVLHRNAVRPYSPSCCDPYCCDRCCDECCDNCCDNFCYRYC